jgi:hypothetical protein
MIYLRVELKSGTGWREEFTLFAITQNIIFDNNRLEWWNNVCTP